MMPPMTALMQLIVQVDFDKVMAMPCMRVIFCSAGVGLRAGV